MITLFVDNLPDDVSLRWVRYFFNKFGVVKDVFIPAKRSKATGRVFAFVRYDCAVSAEMAVSKSNGLWIEERKLFVKKASFDQNKGKDQLKINLIKNNTGNISYNRVGGELRNDVFVPMKNSKSELVGKGVERLDTLSSGYTKSYAQTLKGTQTGKENDTSMEERSLERKLKLKPEGNGWLFRSVVAKLHKLISINELQSQMAKMGIVNIMIRAMGGRSVILTCNNKEERDEVIKLDCLQRWFSEVKPWEGQAACIERFVWLCCYGVPLNGWSNSSFKAVGELWGTFISTDEPTLRLTSFAEAKILVATSEFKEIDEWINIEIEGKLYRVKVLEEPCDQPSVAEKLIPIAVPDSSSPLMEENEDDDDDEMDEHVVDTVEGNKMDGEEKGGNNGNVSMGDGNVNLIGDPTKHDKEQVEVTSTKMVETNVPNRVELPIQTREESMDPTESWDSKSMDSWNGFANVSTQNGVKKDDGELSDSMYVQTTDTLGTTSKGLNSQQLLQDNGQSKGINLMVDLNISQGRIEGLSESFERGEMEVQSDLGCISQRQEYVISNGDVEEVEGLHRQNSKDGSKAPGDKASFDAILKMRSRVRRSERKIKKKKHLAEIETKFDKVNRTKKKGPYSSIFFKEARQMLDMAPILGIEVKGGRNYNLKKFVQMQEEELKERIHALDDFEEEDISEDDVDFKDDASLSLAF